MGEEKMRRGVVGRLIKLHEEMAADLRRTDKKRSRAIKAVADAIDTIIEMEKEACDIAELLTKRIRAK